MSELPLTIADAAQGLRDGSITSVQLTEEALARADDVDPRIGVYLHRRDGAALADAARADAELKRGVDRGSMQGIPLGVKDVFATKDEPTTAQSLVLDPGWGEGRDAPAVARLRAAGAVICGKTTTMEFAAGCPDPEKPFPVPRNPWDTSRWAGGSSSGSASGVATGCFLGALGSDTLGSVRGPAAFSGISGIKPTYGRVPKSGVVPLSRSFDHVGPMARSARDCALMLQVIAGHDPDDPCSVDVAVPDYVARLGGSAEGMRVGVEREHHMRAPGIDPSAIERFEVALGVLETSGAELVDVSIPYFEELKTACATVALRESFTYHRLNLQRRWHDYGRDTRLILGAGALFRAPDLVQARRVIDLVRRRVEEMLTSLDVIVTPTAGAGAPPLEGLSFPVVMSLPYFTPAWNGLGLPAMSVPVGFTADGLPVGLQIIGSPWDEGTVLAVADGYQQLTDWHLRLPPLIG